MFQSWYLIGVKAISQLQNFRRPFSPNPSAFRFPLWGLTRLLARKLAWINPWIKAKALRTLRRKLKNKGRAKRKRGRYRGMQRKIYKKGVNTKSVKFPRFRGFSNLDSTTNMKYLLQLCRKKCQFLNHTPKQRIFRIAYSSKTYDHMHNNYTELFQIWFRNSLICLYFRFLLKWPAQWNISQFKQYIEEDWWQEYSL